MSMLFCCLFAVATLLAADASSIPMWEYLTKEEKTSYLYAMFKSQVDRYCVGSNVENCNQELMKYGLKKLKSMSEDNLDLMDPYQRGASNIIWEQMMEGHSMPPHHSPTTTTTTPTPLPNSYEQTFEDLGSKPAESARYESIVPTPRGNFLPLPVRESIRSGQPLYVRPHNNNNNNNLNSLTYDNGKQVRRDPVGALLTPPPLETGYVERVYPDGRPVASAGSTSQSEDDDLRQYWLSKQKLPRY